MSSFLDNWLVSPRLHPSSPLSFWISCLALSCFTIYHSAFIHKPMRATHSHSIQKDHPIACENQHWICHWANLQSNQCNLQAVYCIHARKILCSQNSDWHSKRPFSKDLCYRWLGAYGSKVLSLHSLWTQRKLHVTLTWCLCHRIPRNRREERNKNRGEQRPSSGPQLEIYS